MDSSHNYGLIVRELRKRAGLSLQKAASLIGKSYSWMSEIENGVGTCRLTSSQFDRIVEALGGSNQRHMFKTWIAGQKNLERKNKEFDGAVLKFFRLRAGLTIATAAMRIGISKGFLSKLETGAAPISLERRNQVMIAYGFSPSSFKNYSTDPVRSKSVPSRLKFEILLRKISEEEAERLFQSSIANFQQQN